MVAEEIESRALERAHQGRNTVRWVAIRFDTDLTDSSVVQPSVFQPCSVHVSTLHIRSEHLYLCIHIDTLVLREYGPSYGRIR